MYEAIVTYDESFSFRIEANNLEMLKNKCKRYIEDNAVFEIQVIKPEVVGYLKSPFDIELL